MSTRTLIIGTPESADLLSKQVGMVADPPKLVGVILIDADPGIREINGLTVLGSIEALGQICSAASVSQAIVSLPAAHRDQWRAISTELQRSGVIERFVTPM
ncbi:MAG: hypothetical protein JKY43_10460, partial [Phycisphaerales bacterium]|nr:hypothetical protein [Phycisphaerales bacterium]